MLPLKLKFWNVKSFFEAKKLSEDKVERFMEAVVDYANATEAAAVNLKRQIAEIVGVKGVVAVKEETFNILKFDRQQGARIGEYEVAYKAKNIPEKFRQAWNILNKNNAVIGDRYHGEGYAYAYWLYGEAKIYRQKLKGKVNKIASSQAREVFERK